MKYATTYRSPIGTLTISSDGEAITGLWMEGQSYFAAGLSENPLDGSQITVIQRTIAVLENYFQGNGLNTSEICLRPQGTPFQRAVWDQLCQIPVGETKTYGQIAAFLEASRGFKTSPRAVGNAVGRNPISILIPCHRIVGADGRLTGYAGGIARKEFLLNLENRNGTTP